jgi:hypothetical protein
MSLVMRGSLTAIAGAVLASALLASPLASSAFAAKQRHHSEYSNGAPASYASRIYRCVRGRQYTYGGGWGCDYYRYSGDYPFGRR